MIHELILASLIGLPTIVGLVYRIFGGRMLRNIGAILTAISLIISSLALLFLGGFSLSPSPIFETMVLVLDFLLLAYFIFVGLRNRSLKIIGLTLLQALPIAYLEIAGVVARAELILFVDNLAILMSLIIGIVGSFIVVYALSYMDEHERHLGLKKSRQPRFFFYMLLLLGAMNGLVFSNSQYWIYFFWEVTTLCCYELIRHDGTEISQRNAIRALWMGLVGGVAFVAAMYVSNYTIGSFALDGIMANGLTPVLSLAFAFLALAAFTKSAQFPFHSWLLGAMVAPTPVSALLHSSTMVNAGVYLILRIAPAIRDTPLTYVVASVGAVTFMLTAVLAISQRISKGVLAYSTMGNLGLIMLCAGINTSLSYAAALALLIFHSISKGLLFLGAGVVENRLHSRNIEDWEGLLKKLPLTTTIMILGMVSMFLPPFGMLLGKWAAVEAVASSSLLSGLPLILLMIIGSAATTLFWVKWLGHLTILPVKEMKLKIEELPKPYLVSMLSLLSLGLTLSVGVALVTDGLIIPIMATTYHVNISTPLLNFSTETGSFLAWPLWLAAVVILLIGSITAKIKGGVVKPPYLGGENSPDNPQTFYSTADSEVEFKVSGIFFDSEIRASRLDRYAVIVGSALLILMFAVVVIG